MVKATKRAALSMKKNPSFTVAQDKQFYYCFGCGAGGNALSFVMEFDRIDFLPAVELLAKNVGLEVPREATANPKAKQHRDDLYSVLNEADKFFGKHCALMKQKCC